MVGKEESVIVMVGKRVGMINVKAEVKGRGMNWEWKDEGLEVGDPSFPRSL